MVIFRHFLGSYGTETEQALDLIPDVYVTGREP
jgi:hypothetical protein